MLRLSIPDARQAVGVLHLHLNLVRSKTLRMRSVFEPDSMEMAGVEPACRSWPIRNRTGVAEFYDSELWA